MPVVRRITPLAAIVAVTVAFIILPIASTAFLGDDQFNSTINGVLRDAHTGVVTVAWETTLGFLRKTSRFVPGFYFQMYPLFHFVPALAPYKAIQIAMYSLDFVLFAALLRALRLSVAQTALTVLISLTAIQFYGHYDAYLGFSATAPYWLALTLASWLAFAAWLRNERATWGWWVALLLFVVCALTYETLWPMSVGHVLIAMQLRGRRGWRAGLPFLGITAAVGVQMIVARIVIPQPPDSMYSLHILSLTYVRTVFYQVTASLPLDHLVFFGSSLFPPGVPFWSAAPWWLLIAVAAVSGAAAFTAFRRLDAGSAQGLLFPALLGAWLWIEAALELAAIPRYQQEVVPGHGYGPMALGGFGAAIVLACGIAALAARIPARRRTASAAVFAVVFAVVLTASFETNERTLVTFEGERAALLNLSAALDDGVAARVPEDSMLLTDSPMQLMGRYYAMNEHSRGVDNPRYFVAEHSGLALRVRGVRQTPSPIECRAATCPVEQTYALYDVPLDVRDGYTAVGRVARVGHSADGTLRPLVADLDVHLRGDRLADLSERAGLVLVYSCAGGSEKIARIALAPAAIRRGAVTKIVPQCVVDLETVQLAEHRSLSS